MTLHARESSTCGGNLNYLNALDHRHVPQRRYGVRSDACCFARKSESHCCRAYIYLQPLNRPVQKQRHMSADESMHAYMTAQVTIVQRERSTPRGSWMFNSKKEGCHNNVFGDMPTSLDVSTYRCEYSHIKHFEECDINIQRPRRMRYQQTKTHGCYACWT